MKKSQIMSASKKMYRIWAEGRVGYFFYSQTAGLPFKVEASGHRPTKVRLLHIYFFDSSYIRLNKFLLLINFMLFTYLQFINISSLPCSFAFSYIILGEWRIKVLVTQRIFILP